MIRENKIFPCMREHNIYPLSHTYNHSNEHAELPLQVSFTGEAVLNCLAHQH